MVSALLVRDNGLHAVARLRGVNRSAKKIPSHRPGKHHDQGRSPPDGQQHHSAPSVRGTIRERFDRFHERNPAVYDRLAELARTWAKSRAGRQSIAMLYEVLRWEWGLSTQGDPFKLNNDYRAYYARLLMEREPDLRGVFETRGVGADPFGHRVHPAQGSLWPDDEGAA